MAQSGIDMNDEEFQARIVEVCESVAPILHGEAKDVVLAVVGNVMAFTISELPAETREYIFAMWISEVWKRIDGEDRNGSRTSH